MFASLKDTFPGTDFTQLSTMTAARAPAWNSPRGGNARGRTCLDDLDIDPALTRAVADAHERAAAVNADKAKKVRAPR